MRVSNDKKIIFGWTIPLIKREDLSRTWLYSLVINFQMWMWWHSKINESLQSIWRAENKQTKLLQKIWHTSPEAGVDFTGRSYDIRSKKQNTNSFSVIGQLSPCARAIVLAVEWHFVPQWGVTVCHAGLCFSVCCHAVPEPWHWHKHHLHSSTPCRALTDLLILCHSVFLYPTPPPKVVAIPLSS